MLDEEEGAEMRMHKKPSYGVLKRIRCEKRLMRERHKGRKKTTKCVMFIGNDFLPVIRLQDWAFILSDVV